MTFKELKAKIDNYEYSKEYYELLKENYEISLLEQFVDNQEFLHNNEELISNINESFFMEKFDKNKIEKIKKEIVKKAKWVGDKLFDAFMFIIKGYIYICVGITKMLFATLWPDEYGYLLKKKIPKDPNKIKANKKDVEKVNEILDKKNPDDPFNKFMAGNISKEILLKLENITTKYLSFLSKIESKGMFDGTGDVLSKSSKKMLNIIFSRDDIKYNSKRYRIDDLILQFKKITQSEENKKSKNSNFLKLVDSAELPNDQTKIEEIANTFKDIQSKISKDDFENITTDDRNTLKTIYDGLKNYLDDFTSLLLMYKESSTIVSIIKENN